MPWFGGEGLCPVGGVPRAGFIARQERNVVRATFRVELTGACDAIDRELRLTQRLHAIETGDCTVDGARQRRDIG